MRGVLQQIVIAFIALYLTSLLLPGLIISGGFQGLFFASIFLVIGFFIVRPVLTILTLPLGALTFGLFSILITAFILFLITIVYSNLVITSFKFPGLLFFFFEIPSFNANIFLSYIIISATIQVIFKIFQYIFDL